MNMIEYFQNLLTVIQDASGNDDWDFAFYHEGRTPWVAFYRTSWLQNHRAVGLIHAITSGRRNDNNGRPVLWIQITFPSRTTRNGIVFLCINDKGFGHEARNKLDTVLNDLSNRAIENDDNQNVFDCVDQFKKSGEEQKSMPHDLQIDGDIHDISDHIIKIHDMINPSMTP